MLLPLPFRPVTTAVVTLSVMGGLAAGVAAGGLLVLASSMARRT